MLDQGSRTAFRGTVGAFQNDNKAEQLSLDLINNKKWFFEHYLPVERLIILMPLLHSENLAAQEAAQPLSLRIAEGLEDPAAKACFAGNGEFFESHIAVVRKFNRFPSRNAALVRGEKIFVIFIYFSSWTQMMLC